jgi:hypothetical protein
MEGDASANEFLKLLLIPERITKKIHANFKIMAWNWRMLHLFHACICLHPAESKLETDTFPKNSLTLRMGAL